MFKKKKPIAKVKDEKMAGATEYQTKPDYAKIIKESKRLRNEGNK